MGWWSGAGRLDELLDEVGGAEGLDLDGTNVADADAPALEVDRGPDALLDALQS